MIALEIALDNLRFLRNEAAKLHEELAAKRDAFEKTIAGERASFALAIQIVGQAEDEVRHLALAAFDGENRRPAPGVEIKMFTTVEYAEVNAFVWALDHKLYLSLNKTAFERFAKSAPSMVPFVAVAEEPRAQIATDLDAALGVKP